MFSYGNKIFKKPPFLTIFLVLWLYLFLPFRIVKFPVIFGQVEEWTVSAVLLSITGLLLFVLFCRKKHFTFHFTVCDILLLLYLVYILFCSGGYMAGREYFLTLYVLVLLYVTVRFLDMNQVRFILPVLFISLITQVIYFLCRQGFTWGNLTAITGIYHNTGIWGGFTGMVLVGVYGTLLFSGRKRLFLSILCIISFVLLVCSQSRAAWIGAFAGGVFLTFSFLRKKYGSRMILPAIVTILLSIPLLVFAGKALYHLKPVSADGRLYI